ncbi:MAG: DUF3846 domain-containing protein [Sphingomonadales bacterium]|nr:DUF3846 domain-containing protein [Sphingomonadales bacterium]
MKAILIDPRGKPPVSEIDVVNELEPLQKIVGGYLEAHRLESGDLLLVDEDYNMKANPKFKGKFDIKWVVRPGRTRTDIFGGRGLIVGSKGDNFTDPKLNLLAASRLANIHIS